MLSASVLYLQRLEFCLTINELGGGAQLSGQSIALAASLSST